jgi:hypothetical protein
MTKSSEIVAESGAHLAIERVVEREVARRRARCDKGEDVDIL